MKPAVAATAAGLMLSVISTPASAQTPTAQPRTEEPGLQELAKDKKNPLADAFKVPFEFTTGFRIGPNHNTGENLNIQPVVPFALTSDWNLIARPLIPLTYVPEPIDEFGLADVQLSLFLTPAGAERWIWGAGPIFQFPTASSSDLGAGKWAAGPTGALVYSDGPWFNGVLASHLWSFAGDRARSEVNQTSFEVLLSYNFANGSYIQFDPVSTYDWSANGRNAWTVPVGMDVGKVFKIGSRAISVQLGAYDYVQRPQDAAQWMIRTQIMLLFPRGQ